MNLINYHLIHLRVMIHPTKSGALKHELANTLTKNKKKKHKTQAVGPVHCHITSGAFRAPLLVVSSIIVHLIWNIELDYPTLVWKKRKLVKQFQNNFFQLDDNDGCDDSAT